jgi:hypothetical protein
VAELLQDLAEEAFHSIADPWLLILAVAGHIQSADLIVTCWVGQNPRLQAKASAFLDTRQGGIEGARLYDLGA